MNWLRGLVPTGRAGEAAAVAAAAPTQQQTPEAGAYSGPALSRGAVRSIVVDVAADLTPVLQVLEVKQFAGGVFGGGAFRLWLSDGEHFCQTLVYAGTFQQLVERAGGVPPQRHDIMRVNKCVARRCAFGRRTRCTCAARSLHLRTAAAVAPGVEQVPDQGFVFASR